MYWVASRWRGDAKTTYKELRANGYNVTQEIVSKISCKPEFPLEVARYLSKNPTCASKEELHAWLTQVMRGEVEDGVEYEDDYEVIARTDDDYDMTLGGEQYRKIKRAIPKMARLSDRIKAGDLIGKILGVFSQQMNVKGDISFSIAELLDDELKKELKVVEAAPAVPVLEMNTSSLLD